MCLTGILCHNVATNGVKRSCGTLANEPMRGTQSNAMCTNSLATPFIIRHFPFIQSLCCILFCSQSSMQDNSGGLSTKFIKPQESTNISFQVVVWGGGGSPTEELMEEGIIWLIWRTRFKLFTLVSYANITLQLDLRACVRCEKRYGCGWQPVLYYFYFIHTHSVQSMLCLFTETWIPLSNWHVCIASLGQVLWNGSGHFCMLLVGSGLFVYVALYYTCFR